MTGDSQAINVWVCCSADMATHMKTTIEIPDPLLNQVRELASRQNSTVKALVESGLRTVIRESEARQSSAGFHLRRASFEGNGLQPAIRGSSWDRLRELAYEDHGG